MPTGVMLDRCGLDEAMRGRPPVFGDGDGDGVVVVPDQFIVPSSEYHARVRLLVDEYRRGRRPGRVTRLFDGLAGAAQPWDLTVAALSHPRIAAALYDIPIEVHTSTPEEHLTAIRLVGRFEALPIQFEARLFAALFVAAYLHSNADGAVVCSRDRAVVTMLELHAAEMSFLDHDCHRRYPEAS